MVNIITEQICHIYSSSSYDYYHMIYLPGFSAIVDAIKHFSFRSIQESCVLIIKLLYDQHKHFSSKENMSSK
jgi:hypothetical protein